MKLDFPEAANHERRKRVRTGSTGSVSRRAERVGRAAELPAPNQSLGEKSTHPVYAAAYGTQTFPILCLTLQFNLSIAHPVHHCPSRSARRMARSREIHSCFWKLEGSERCANLQGLNRLRSRTRSQRTLSNALWSRGNDGAQLERL